MNIDEIEGEDVTDGATAQGKGHVTPDELLMSKVTNNSMFMSTTAADPFSRVSESIRLVRQDIMESQNSEDRRIQFQVLEKKLACNENWGKFGIKTFSRWLHYPWVLLEQ